MNSLNSLNNTNNKNELKDNTNNKLKDSIDSVAGGGKSVRNVYVNITKLVENLTVQASTVKESAHDIERMVQEYLLRAIHGSELAMNNG